MNQDILNAVIDQRNDALNRLALATAELAALKREQSERKEQEQPSDTAETNEEHPPV